VLESCELCRPHVHLFLQPPTDTTDKTRRRRTSTWSQCLVGPYTTRLPSIRNAFRVPVDGVGLYKTVRAHVLNLHTCPKCCAHPGQAFDTRCFARTRLRALSGRAPSTSPTTCDREDDRHPSIQESCRHVPEGDRHGQKRNGG
jgi:hypothetical protein